jgi:cystathionine gamma-synthase
MLLPTANIADELRSFMVDRSTRENGTPVSVRLVQYLICPTELDESSKSADKPCVDLHIALFPSSAFPVAKQFWQHTGMGISSRLAEYALLLIAEADKSAAAQTAVPTHRPNARYQNRHYSSVKKGVNTTPQSSSATSSPPPVESQDALSGEHSTYLEERYGRNFPLSDAPAAKRAMRRRIAGTLVHDAASAPEADVNPVSPPTAGAEDVELGPSSRGVREVTERDVFLYPTGMTAIWSAHALARAVRPVAKSICFG